MIEVRRRRRTRNDDRLGPAPIQNYALATTRSHVDVRPCDRSDGAGRHLNVVLENVGAGAACVSENVQPRKSGVIYQALNLHAVGVHQTQICDAVPEAIAGIVSMADPRRIAAARHARADDEHRPIVADVETRRAHPFRAVVNDGRLVVEVYVLFSPGGLKAFGGLHQMVASDSVIDLRNVALVQRDLAGAPADDRRRIREVEHVELVGLEAEWVDHH